jgi:PIN domain nuclease of toxin-antitoxin system
MTLSLDTHTFLWWLDDTQLLSKAAREAISFSHIFEEL